MNKLKPGDKVAAVSPSWGGAGAYPERFASGKQALETRFGLELGAMPHALASETFVAQHPEARAADIHQAFTDPKIKAVIACIGGDDVIRVLPFLDADLLRTHPKPFLGYSDITALHLYFHGLGIPCFYGPAIMAGFAEAGGMFDYTERAVRQLLFDRHGSGIIPVDNGEWCNSMPDFDQPDGPPRPRLPAVARKTLQGTHKASGRLLGGCFEVLEFCRGTPAWPDKALWQDSILFFEIADGDKYTHPDRITWFFRSLFVSGELRGVRAILMGRTGQDVAVERYQAFEQALIEVLSECGLSDIPVIGRMEFGHTDPMWVLPYGAETEVSPETASVTLLDDILER